MSTKSMPVTYDRKRRELVLHLSDNQSVTVVLESDESVKDGINRAMKSLKRTDKDVIIVMIARSDAENIYEITYQPYKPSLATFADMARNEVPDTTAAAFLGIEADIFVIDLNSNFIHVSNDGERNYVVDIATTSGGLWEIPHHAMNEYWCGFTASLAPTDSVVFEIKSNGQHERLEAVINGTRSHIIDTRNV